MEFPQYRKNESNGQTIFVKFTGPSELEVIDIEPKKGFNRPWKIGKTSSIHKISVGEWEPWDGNIYPTLKKYKIPKH